MRPNPLMPTRIAILSVSLWLPPVAECRRPAEGHKTNNACAAIAERGSARVQGRGGGHHVIHENDMTAAKCVLRRKTRQKRARNAAESVPWCQPRLCFGMTRARENVRPYGDVPPIRQFTR